MIKLSLTSSLFRQELDSDARELLATIAFFPQGINEENIDWLFPTISNQPDVLNKLYMLSLTYRSNGFVTMLAPLRDHFRPKNPKSSLLLDATKERYFSRLSAQTHPDTYSIEESQWIISEDVNVEHLLDVFTSVDVNSKDVWDVCAIFMEHLYFHKPRLTTLGPKIEALSDNHPSKPKCLDRLSVLFQSVGNQVERKRVLVHALKLWRDRRDDYHAAVTLGGLSDANRSMGLCKEGIQQAKEALEIFERLGNTWRQADGLLDLARSLFDDEQLDAAEEAASRAMDLAEKESRQCLVFSCHHMLGICMCRSKGNTEKAIHHFEEALRIASSLGDFKRLFEAHFAVVPPLFTEGRFDDAHAHLERAKSYAVNDAYNLARASQSCARLWGAQGVFGEAKSEALRALGIFEKLGATNDAEEIRELLGHIDRDAMDSDLAASNDSDNNGESPQKKKLLVMCVNSSYLDWVTESG